MADQFSVTGAITPTNPKTGDTVTLTISGDDVQTTSVPGTIGPLQVALVAADGATQNITIPAVACTVTTSTHQSVKITGVTDPAGRVWKVAADGLTATATV